MTPYERLMAEDIPTRPPAKPPNEPWTPQEQAQHLTELLEGIDGWHDPSTQAEKKRQRHLRLITDQPDQTAA
jgi:hypothetical protein